MKKSSKRKPKIQAKEEQKETKPDPLIQEEDKFAEKQSIFEEPSEEERKVASTHWEIKKSLKPFYSGGRVAMLPGSSEYLVSMCNSAVHVLKISNGNSKVMIRKVEHNLY